MKLNKKFLASFMAMTMVAAPMSAYADNYVITGTGNVTTLETEIYNVVLPTSNSIDFNVDPYGLTDIPADVTLEDLVSGASGTVTSSATAVINKSSMPLDISMELFFDTNSTTASNSAVSLAALDKVKKGEGDLYLEVVPLSGTTLSKVVTDKSLALSANAIGLPVSDKAFTLSSTPLSIATAGEAITGVAITATGSAASTTASGTAINFSLGDVAYAYYVQTGGSITALTAEAVLRESAVQYDTNNVYAFAISGYANPSSPVWLAMTKSKGANLELTAKFTISSADTSAKAYLNSVNSNGAALIGITDTPANGGITKLADLTNVKVNGVSVTPWTSLVTGNFALIKGTWNYGDVVTFEYEGTAYKVTLTQ